MLESTSMLCLSPMSGVPDTTCYSPSCPMTMRLMQLGPAADTLPHLST